MGRVVSKTLFDTTRRIRVENCAEYVDCVENLNELFLGNSRQKKQMQATFEPFSDMTQGKLKKTLETLKN